MTATPPQTPRNRRRVFTRGSWPEARRTAEVLRDETAGGLLLVAAALIALIWANSPIGDAYFDARDWHVGPEALHLNLSIGHWAADGLLAIFFFVAGLELKREFIAGDLRDPRRAALPIVAAVGGMIVPALIYVAINSTGPAGATHGWAIPVATDIAFALAVLAVISSHLPTALRTFLLTLAVVDDLLAIIIIAVFFTSELDLLMLGLAVLPILAFGAIAQRKGRAPWFVMVPLAVLAWGLVHASGIHATVAGVLLAFTMPVARGEGETGIAEHLEHLLRPVSAGLAVPVFAFFSAGVAVGGLSGLGDALGETITLGIILGLVIGKTLGVLGATFLMTRFTKSELDESVAWIDVVGIAVLAGIGFTVSLLIGELAFEGEPERGEFVKVGVLLGSLTAAILASLLLSMRNRHYRRIAEQETADADADGIPDVYQRTAPPA